MHTRLKSKKAVQPRCKLPKATQENMNGSSDDPSHARVSGGQRLLLPPSAREVCDQLGLNWWAALKLHDDGWVSFNPETTPELDQAQETELRFVGSLVTAGCEPRLLEQLLKGLERPYCYAGHRIYYDWSARRWRLLPVVEEPDLESVFADWLESLKEAGDAGQLESIKAGVQAALDSLRTKP